VSDLKKDMKELKDDYTATASQLKKATTNCLVLSTTFEEAAAV
jgi:hypothetical protein